jgi:hypothetical protein
MTNAHYLLAKKGIKLMSISPQGNKKFSEERLRNHLKKTPNPLLHPSQGGITPSNFPMRWPLHGFQPTKFNKLSHFNLEEKKDA